MFSRSATTELRQRRSKAIALALTLLFIAPQPTLAAQTTTTAAQQFKDIDRAGRSLAVRFQNLLMAKDTAGLQAFLAPAFQLQRADGSHATKAEYLAKPAVITGFKIANVQASQTAATIVVRYDADISGIVNGHPYAPGPAPRLSVFTWNGSRWQLLAHANFNAGAAPAVGGSEVLLNKQMTTILGQSIAYPTGTAQVSSALITLLPGQQTGWHRHDAPLYGYIVSGTLSIAYDGNITKVYAPGTAFMEALGTYHNGSNLTNEPVVILAVNIGADGVANTVMKL